MEKELGKWFMDIAKYMVTAILLARVFGDVTNPFIAYLVVVISLLVLVTGLLLVRYGENQNTNNKGKNRKGKK